MEEMQVSSGIQSWKTPKSLGIQPWKRRESLWEFNHGRDPNLSGNATMEET